MRGGGPSHGAFVDGAALPQLPRVVRTKNGVEFDPSGDIWRYQDGVENVTLNFRALCEGFSAGLVHIAKCTLCWYAATKSPSHLKNSFDRLVNFAKQQAVSGEPLDAIGSAHLINYVGQLDEARVWQFGALGGVLKRWHRLGYPGLAEDGLRLLRQLRVRGNRKGEAVLTMDPLKGPLTQVEQEALHSALNNAFADGVVEIEDYVLAWLYLFLGQRNRQYALLKVCDVRLEFEESGAPRYTLVVPSGKKPSATHRDRFVERPLIEQFGALLHKYAKEVESTFEGVLDDPTQAPLFPNHRGERSVPGFLFHRAADSLGHRLKVVLERLGAVSERTGEPLKVHMRRLRQTLATRAAEEGHGPFVIAALLDHSDIQNVGIYAGATATVLDRINRAIAFEMAPLAQAFAGVISEKGREDVGSERGIIDLRIDRSGGEFGRCRKEGPCGFAAPIACYTCKSYRAWEDAPHEAVLDYLLKRREERIRTCGKKIASINDRTIFAVAVVVRACNENRRARLGALNG